MPANIWDMKRQHAELLTGSKDMLPILLGTLPFGLIYGVSTHGGALSAPEAQAMSFIVFAGASQFIMVQLLNAGVSMGIIILTTTILNLRHALYSASLAPYLKELRLGWKMLLAYLLTDEVYAIAITHYQQKKNHMYSHWYFLGAGLALWSTWQISSAIGILLGANVPASWSLDFALPLTFIALVVPTLKKKADIIAAGTAGLLAILVAHFPFNSGLLIATFFGIATAVVVDIQSQKRQGNNSPEKQPYKQPEANGQLTREDNGQ